MPFDYTLDFHTINFRDDPFLYRVGVGEQGVLLVEPYKSELLPLWRFKTPDIAKKSSQAIYRQFLKYKKDNDFIGMDMARKYLQMGYTRSRRYANHASGKKYEGPVPDFMKGISGSHGRKVLPKDSDPVKAKSAEVFYKIWKKVEKDSLYKKMRTEWKKWYG